MGPELDDLVDACAKSRADDWAFWVYVCDDAPAAGRHYARAVWCSQRSIGLAWSEAVGDDFSHLPEWAAPVFGEDCVYHWVELLYDGLMIDRSLAAWLAEAGVSLPAPHAEPRGDGGHALWVRRRDMRLVRLANRVDPGCGDFDACFLRSGMELRER